MLTETDVQDIADKRIAAAFRMAGDIHGVPGHYLFFVADRLDPPIHEIGICQKCKLPIVGQYSGLIGKFCTCDKTSAVEAVTP